MRYVNIYEIQETDFTNLLQCLNKHMLGISNTYVLKCIYFFISFINISMGWLGFFGLGFHIKPKTEQKLLVF